MGFANYKYLDGVGDEADYNFQCVADLTLTMGLNQEIGAFSVGVLGKAFSSVDGHLSPIAALYLLDVNLGWAQKVGDKLLHHTLALKNANNREMLITEYIRQTPIINRLATTGFGRRLIYSAKVDFWVILAREYPKSCLLAFRGAQPSVIF
ncbi:MAG: hypothetical protein ACI9UK_002360 [Candidatus Krumholzibacteriia bacterium]|jgi:hypothetical protein